MKKIFITIMIAGEVMIFASCNKSSDKVKDSIEIQGVEQNFEETSLGTSEEICMPVQDDSEKTHAEKLLSECTQRVKSYIEFGRAIENVAMKAYLNSPVKENESYEDWKKRAEYKNLSDCMSAFTVYQKQLDIAYEKFYQHDYEAVVRLVHLTFDGINTGYTNWHDKLLSVNLSIDQMSYNDDNYNKNNSTFNNENESYPQSTGSLDAIQPSDISSPSGHYETRTERCIDCQGRGYNEKTIWHGGDKTSTVQIRCSFCHGKGTITKREYVFDN